MEYHYEGEEENYRFYQVPAALIEDPQYAKLSAEAILLYAVMLSRMALSARRERWHDQDGKIFIYYRIEDAMKNLHCHTEKAVKVYKELETAGLIERKRQGQGMPTKIYVLKFVNRKIRISKNENQEVRESKVPYIGNKKSKIYGGVTPEVARLEREQKAYRNLTAAVATEEEIRRYAQALKAEQTAKAAKAESDPDE